jgi:V8-like Glu-specific endopeptidase
MKLKKIFVFCFSLLISTVQSDEVLPKPLPVFHVSGYNVSNDRIFSPDERKPVTKKLRENYPYRTVGRIRYESFYCTATLVSEDVILTARHCVVQDQYGNLSPSFLSLTKFEPGYQFGQSLFTSPLLNESYISGTNNDWALIRIKKKLGRTLGFIEVQDFQYTEFENPISEITFISYSFDFLVMYRTSSYQHNCSLRARRMLAGSRKLILHDCDSYGGSSGTAMILKDKVVGVHFGHFIDGSPLTGGPFTYGRANVMDPSEAFYELYLQMVNVTKPSEQDECKQTKHYIPKCKKVKRKKKCNKACNCFWKHEKCKKKHDF